MDKEKEKEFYKRLKFNLDDVIKQEVIGYIDRYDLDELELSRFELTLKHKNSNTNLTDAIISLFIDSDNELKYKVINLMLDKEYVEVSKNISVETKIIVLGQLELSKNNKWQN